MLFVRGFFIVSVSIISFLFACYELGTMINATVNDAVALVCTARNETDVNATATTTATIIDPSYVRLLCDGYGALVTAAAEAAAATPGAEPEADECASEPPLNYSKSLHIGAVFIILFASTVGCLLPILGK